MRAHERTFKPPRLKSQICLIGGNGFCAAAGEDELKRRWEDLGMRCQVFYLLENDWDMEGMIWQIE